MMCIGIVGVIGVHFATGGGHGCRMVGAQVGQIARGHDRVVVVVCGNVVLLK